MICLKTLRPRLIYSLFLLFAAFFSLSFGQQSASATSQSIVFDSNSDLTNDSLVYQESNATFPGSPLLSFVPKYVEISFDSSMNYLYRYCGSNGYGVLSSFQGSGYNFSAVACFHSSFSYSVNLETIWSYSSDNYGLMIRPGQFSNLFSSGLNSITYTFYDSLPGSDCPECPPIPETEYGDALDKIYHAIILVPAMAFVLYLFFIFYSWYLGGHR